MPLHSLHEVPDIQREFLIIENGDKALVIKGGNYKEIENWLAGQLVHTKWIKVMENIANCKFLGNYTLFDIGINSKTTLVVRIYIAPRETK
ncbi:hypothetical protein KAR91_72055 [Candidatus Pacearchaeota archaeon]|nr:hypothetical protein [Candidatus Pacearchaeota archaeon]